MWSLPERIKNKLLSSLKVTKTISLKDQTIFLNKHGWEVIDSTETWVKISNQNQKIKIRKGDSSDFEVFKQIFIHQEYSSALSFFRSNDIKLENVIDAGANIGLTSLYIKSKFPDAKIACIEPENENFKILEDNLKLFSYNSSVQLFKAGLMGISNLNLSIGSSFRGGGDWAKQVVLSDQDSTLKSISIRNICEKMNFNNIDFLKIDIEGAETFLIEKDTDLSFLRITKIIAIEIHDEYNCRSQIYDILRQFHFLLLEVGETTFAINKHLI